MQTEQVQLDRNEALRLYREYRQHQHFATEVDREIQKVYRLIAQGRVVIQALASIAAAGVGSDGLPKLAIVRADAKECFYRWENDQTIRFSMNEQGWSEDHHTRQYIDMPAPWGWKRAWQVYGSIVPLIPLHLRPRTALDTYHILYEAEWTRVVPKDPMLLRRLGAADLWLVVAAWDLTDIERAVLQARVSA